MRSQACLPFPIRSGIPSPRFATETGLQDVRLAIDTPVVDSEGCLMFEVGIADKMPSSTSETLKPFVSAILTEAFIGTSGPMDTGVVIATTSAAEQASLSGGVR
jgi:hypothetical protein